MQNAAIEDRNIAFLESTLHHCLFRKKSFFLSLVHIPKKVCCRRMCLWKELSVSHGVLHVLERDEYGVQGFHRDEGVLGAGKNNRVRVNALTRSPRIRFINTLL